MEPDEEIIAETYTRKENGECFHLAAFEWSVTSHHHTPHHATFLQNLLNRAICVFVCVCVCVLGAGIGRSSMWVDPRTYMASCAPIAF